MPRRTDEHPGCIGHSCGCPLTRGERRVTLHTRTRFAISCSACAKDLWLSEDRPVRPLCPPFLPETKGRALGVIPRLGFLFAWSR